MNKYGEEFYELYNANREHDYFVDLNIRMEHGNFAVVEFVPVNSILNNCYKIAVEKAKHTMDESQSLKKREKDKKIINQFKGIMAEAAIHIYLDQRCDFSINNIFRWDLERTNFDNANNEYDIKILQNGVDYVIESRSSSSYRTDLPRFMKYYDIIGKYSNQRKNNERVSDMYIRPVFQYINLSLTKEQYEERVYRTFSDISSNTLKLYLVASVGKDEMYGEHGYEKSMGQGPTKYQCIKIKDAHDIESIEEIYINAMRERGIL